MKKVIKILLVLVIVIWIVSLLGGYTQVIFCTNGGGGRIDSLKGEVGDTISLFEQFDFSDGDWVAYVVIDRNERKDFPLLKASNCYKTSNVDILNGMKSEWNVIVSGGDMATVASKLVLVRNGKVEFTTGIVLQDSHEGLQSDEYGWVIPVKKNVLLKYCSEFKRVFSPILFL